MYKTINSNSNAEIIEKKSKFISNIFYVDSVKQADNYIKSIKKKYFDAKHHCFAYRIRGEGDLKEKQSDDGEPTGTAGMPILNILQKNDLTNVLVVVTRYFGGTLLGTGGLVRAYSDVTVKAIKNAEIINQEFGYELKIIIKYKDLEKFYYYCHKHAISILQIFYEENIICIIELTQKEKIKLLEDNQNEIPILNSIILKEKYVKIVS